jgi:hypothetical protein
MIKKMKFVDDFTNSCETVGNQMNVHVLGKISDYTLLVYKNYQGDDNAIHKKILQPVKAYTDEKKIEGMWDDYDEYMHNLIWFKQNPKIIDAHVIEAGGQIVGVALGIIGDAFEDFCKKYNIKNEESKALQLACFYINKEFRGIGERWVREIFRYYSVQGFLHAYIVTAHRKAFSLYQRLSNEIGNFYIESDHGLYLRLGKIFKCDLL